MIGGLYDWRGEPIGAAPPFPCGSNIPLIAQVLCTADTPSCPGVTRLWLLPAGDKLPAIPRRISDEMVAALEHGMLVAVLGTDANAVRAAAAAVLQLAGEA